MHYYILLLNGFAAGACFISTLFSIGNRNAGAAAINAGFSVANVCLFFLNVQAL